MTGPVKLTAVCKDYLWGGTRLRDEFGKKCSLDKVAESWELSCHRDGPSVVSGTDHTLKDFIDENGWDIRKPVINFDIVPCSYQADRRS